MDDYVCDCHLEMLRLSQDQQNPQSIQFDESNWQLHLSSLKPLGLNVLLNLCNPGVTTTLCRFSDHLRHIALQETNCSVLPGHIPWGLCDFSRLIGTYLSIYVSVLLTFMPYHFWFLLFSPVNSLSIFRYFEHFRC